MLTLKGKYTSANIYADIYTDDLLEQIRALLDLDYLKDCHIAIMPDCHVGAGACIGTTIKVNNRAIAPGLVGIDIGCGMTLIRLPIKEIDYKLLDDIIHHYVPSGFNVHQDKLISFDEFDNFSFASQIKDLKNYVECSLGTLGGGNHFIEIDRDENGYLNLLIHSGSRYLGLIVNKHYVKLANTYHQEKIKNAEGRKKLIDHLKSIGKEREISEKLKEFDKEIQRNDTMPIDLYPVVGQDFENYIHDIEIVQRFASTNRYLIAKTILDGLKISFDACTVHECIHNYINTKDMILRKGAISAYKDEFLIIPISMKDGAIIASGKGDADYNFSCPHGAGRVLSRREAKNEITLEQYKKSMTGIYSTSINQNTIDESCFAYKPLESIIDNIQKACVIKEIIKPTYSFKAG